MKPHKRQARGWAANAGFTLIEALISTVLMAVVVSALAVFTAQWLPNWNHGFARVQQMELTARGLERIVADVTAADFIPPIGDTKGPLFYGTERSVRLVRSALGPNTRSGLEFVHIGETADDRGLAMVRVRAPFVPIALEAFDNLRLSDPVVLIRAPFRVSFAYAGPDRVWRDSWRGATSLPNVVRVTLRDAATARVLAISTATVIHVNAPADCVQPKDAKNCDLTKTASAK